MQFLHTGGHYTVAFLQKVETGQYGNDTVEIVSGLQKGDRVVTAGVQKLHEGEEVRL